MKREDQAGSPPSSGGKARGARMHPVDWVAEAGAVGDVLRELDGELRRRRRNRLSAAIGGAAALLFAGLIWQQVNRQALVPATNAAPSAVVSLPEQKLLPDGSLVDLRNGTEISIAFTADARRVILTRGEAHFQVAKSALPFLVAVNAVEVRAVGTAFSVQLGSSDVEVLVTEGRVEVSQRADGAEPVAPVRNQTELSGSLVGGLHGLPANGDGILVPRIQLRVPAVMVEAGNRLLIPASYAKAAPFKPEMVPVESAELSARLAWRAPRLEFSRTPLTKALAMMKEHAPAGKELAVTLADPALGQVRVSGILRADNLETLLRLLEDQHGIRAEKRGSDEVILRRLQ